MPVLRGGRPAWNPGIVAGERRRPAASSSSSDTTAPRTRRPPELRAGAGPLVAAGALHRREHAAAGDPRACRRVAWERGDCGGHLLPVPVARRKRDSLVTGVVDVGGLVMRSSTPTRAGGAYPSVR